MNSNPFELLAPGGDIDSIKAAIAAGADAVYCGLDRFNARNRATNLTLDTLKEILQLAHQNECKIFLTLNIALLESEIPSVVRLLQQLNKTHIDGIIIQDLGLAYILKHHFPELDVHASTQVNSHNEGQILFMKQLGASRVNLSRELNIDEIKHLAKFGQRHGVLMEVFVHGSYCIGFSGLCYMSSARNGASGNRGRCSQPCRDGYKTTDVGVDHPLNLKDNSAFLDLKQLADAGVYSLKIEGRIKKPHYVYTVVDQWRQQIDNYTQSGEILTDTTPLYKVFNRDFSDGYLQGNIGQSMYIDNPRNHSAKHFALASNRTSDAEFQEVKRWVYDESTSLIEQVDQKIKALDCQYPQDVASDNRIAKSIPFTPLIPTQNSTVEAPSESLAVLISSEADIPLVENTNVAIFYQLPTAISKNLDKLVALFQHNKNLIPWFPSIIIGDDFEAAEQLLDLIQPSSIVANNTGVGYLAYQKGIKWIAGPQLNVMNSYALLALKSEFNCAGAFISNEINRQQLKRIIKPDDFHLFYSIYHPIDLMVSRQCLFQQTSGCKKTKLTKSCLTRCEKTTSIINLNGSAYVINKRQGEHNHIYADQHYLNTDILNELPNLFTDLLIDLRNIPTNSKVSGNKPSLIAAFQTMIENRHTEPVHQLISSTTNQQYIKGL